MIGDNKNKVSFNQLESIFFIIALNISLTK